MGVHLLRDCHVGKGVHARLELLPLVLEVGPDLEEPVFPLLAPELSMERLRCAIGHHRHLARNSQALQRKIVGIAAPAAPFRVRVDCLPLALGHADLPRRVVSAAGDRHHSLHKVSSAERPLQGLHAPQRAAHHRGDLVGAKLLLHHAEVQLHGVSHGDLREVDQVGQLRLRIQAHRPGGAVAGAQNVGAHDQVLVGVEGLAGPQQPRPPLVHLAVARERMAHDEHVVLGSVELSIRIVAHLCAVQPLATLQLQSLDHKTLPRGRQLSVLVLHATAAAAQAANGASAGPAAHPHLQQAPQEHRASKRVIKSEIRKATRRAFTRVK
mmetsp:Transcript_4819/g.19324  ORF Transcript_4819/g.19324 Transcript_4819/m.19324 type:complete len:325 (+) Transcript_4819:330-1304(+)|eukprot:scaffold1954_cov268-Pinguiococcus_pyrenoidosus.AAC.239